MPQNLLRQKRCFSFNQPQELPVSAYYISATLSFVQRIRWPVLIENNLVTEAVNAAIWIRPKLLQLHFWKSGEMSTVRIICYWNFCEQGQRWNCASEKTIDTAYSWYPMTPLFGPEMCLSRTHPGNNSSSGSIKSASGCVYWLPKTASETNW